MGLQDCVDSIIKGNQSCGFVSHKEKDVQGELLYISCLASSQKIRSIMDTLCRWQR